MRGLTSSHVSGLSDPLCLICIELFVRFCWAVFPILIFRKWFAKISIRRSWEFISPWMVSTCFWPPVCTMASGNPSVLSLHVALFERHVISLAPFSVCMHQSCQFGPKTRRRLHCFGRALPSHESVRGIYGISHIYVYPIYMYHICILYIYMGYPIYTYIISRYIGKP